MQRSLLSFLAVLFLTVAPSVQAEEATAPAVPQGVIRHLEVLRSVKNLPRLLQETRVLLLAEKNKGLFRRRRHVLVVGSDGNMNVLARKLGSSLIQSREFSSLELTVSYSTSVDGEDRVSQEQSMTLDPFEATKPLLSLHLHPVAAAITQLQTGAWPGPPTGTFRSFSYSIQLPEDARPFLSQEVKGQHAY